MHISGLHGDVPRGGCAGFLDDTKALWVDAEHDCNDS
jgi:hypothetical protein